MKTEGQDIWTWYRDLWNSDGASSPQRCDGLQWWTTWMDYLKHAE